MTQMSLGLFHFWGCVRCEPVAMEHVFPVVCFLHCASNADYLYVNAKESLAENALLRSPLSKIPLVRGNPGGR
jgi:hypothetical protein